MYRQNLQMKTTSLLNLHKLFPMRYLHERTGINYDRCLTYDRCINCDRYINQLRQVHREKTEKWISTHTWSKDWSETKTKESVHDTPRKGASREKWTSEREGVWRCDGPTLHRSGHTCLPVHTHPGHRDSRTDGQVSRDYSTPRKGRGKGPGGEETGKDDSVTEEKERDL